MAAEPVDLRIDPNRFTRADVAGDTFLLDQVSGHGFRIGGSGPRLWDLLVGGASPADAARIIAAETGADADVVARDVHDFVEELRVAGMLDGGSREAGEGLRLRPD